MSDVQTVLAKLAEGMLDTDYGQFRMGVFHDGSEQAVTIGLGTLTGQEDVLCRIHSECICSHVFFGRSCDCRQQMQDSQRLIQAEGRGLIIFLHQEGRGNGAAAHVATLDLKRTGVEQGEAYRLRGFPQDNRGYSIAVKIIKHLGIKSIRLISSNKGKVELLRTAGIKVTPVVHSGCVMEIGPRIRNVVSEIKAKRADPPFPPGERQRVFVIGDLNIDYVLPDHEVPANQIAERPEPRAGGTGLNAAREFYQAGFDPVVFGKIGNDRAGQLLRSALESDKLTSLIETTDDKPTGSCTLVFFGADQRLMIQETANANDYDPDNLEQAICLAPLRPSDLIFLVGHPLVRFDPKHTRRLLDIVSGTRARILLDVVPHNIDEKIRFADFEDAVQGRAHVIIGEFNTLMRLVGVPATGTEPVAEDLGRLVQGFRCQFLVIRYGTGNIQVEEVWEQRATGPHRHQQRDTGYSQTPKPARRGFGDRLTAQFALNYFGAGKNASTDRRPRR